MPTHTPTVPRVSCSRLAALWDEHRYWTRRMLWEYCAHGRRPTETQDLTRARTGRALEHAVLEMAAADLACQVVHLPQGQEYYVRHPELPLGCIADGYVLHPELGPGLVSVKCVSSAAWGPRWRSMAGGVPRDVEIQLQGELLVWEGACAPGGPLADFEAPRWGCVAAMHDLDVHLFRREIDHAFRPVLTRALTDFFGSIASGSPPEWGHVAEELPVILQAYPDRDPGSWADIPDDDPRAGEALEAMQMLERATEDRREAERMRDEAKVRLLDLAGDNGAVRALGMRCRVTTVQTRPSTIPCPACATPAEVRRGGTQTRFTVREA